MSKAHLIKRIDDLDKDTKLVHFNDGTPSLKVQREESKFKTRTRFGDAESSSMHAVIKHYHEKSKPVEEAIITVGKYSGQRGQIILVEEIGGLPRFTLADSNNNKLGVFSEDQIILTDLKEEANVVGGGAIAGAGVGPMGEPGVSPNRTKAIALILDMLRRKQLH